MRSRQTNNRNTSIATIRYLIMRQKQVGESNQGVEEKLQLLKTLQQTNKTLKFKSETGMYSFVLRQVSINPREMVQ